MGILEQIFGLTCVRSYNRLCNGLYYLNTFSSQHADIYSILNADHKHHCHHHHQQQQHLISAVQYGIPCLQRQCVTYEMCYGDGECGSHINDLKPFNASYIRHFN